MPTFNERLKTQNRKLAEKQKQLDKLNKTIETARESIKVINREIGEIKDEINSLETRILTEAISQRGISVAELAAALETGAILPEKPPDAPENNSSTTEKEVLDETYLCKASHKPKLCGEEQNVEFSPETLYLNIMHATFLNINNQTVTERLR